LTPSQQMTDDGASYASNTNFNRTFKLNISKEK